MRNRRKGKKSEIEEVLGDKKIQTKQVMITEVEDLILQEIQNATKQKDVQKVVINGNEELKNINEELEGGGETKLIKRIIKKKEILNVRERQKQLKNRCRKKSM